MTKNNVKATTLKKFKGEKKSKIENERLKYSVENKIRNEKELHYIDHDIEDNVEMEEDNRVILIFNKIF